MRTFLHFNQLLWMRVFCFAFFTLFFIAFSVFSITRELLSFHCKIQGLSCVLPFVLWKRSHNVQDMVSKLTFFIFCHFSSHFLHFINPTALHQKNLIPLTLHLHQFSHLGLLNQIILQFLPRFPYLHLIRFTALISLLFFYFYHF